MKKHNSLGFTLIELLVVISIIGVLSALILVSFSGSQKQARDAERKSDVKQYQTAIESFANNNNSLFPDVVGGGATVITNLCSTLGLGATCPDDPGAPTYHYYYRADTGGASLNDASQYVIYATMESQPAATGFLIVCSNGKTGYSDKIPPSYACPI